VSRKAFSTEMVCETANLSPPHMKQEIIDREAVWRGRPADDMPLIIAECCSGEEARHAQVPHKEVDVLKKKRMQLKRCSVKRTPSAAGSGTRLASVFSQCLHRIRRLMSDFLISVKDQNSHFWEAARETLQATVGRSRNCSDSV
jgi:hypothetical protein